MATPARKVEISPPAKRSSVVIDGWSVPFLEAQELDGGRVFLKLDRRFSLEVDVKDFDSYTAFIANAIAVALGYWSHPSGEVDVAKKFTAVPHPALRPRHVVEIEAQAGTGEVA